MPTDNLYKAIRYIADIIQISEARGLLLEVSTDFEEFRKVRMAQSDRSTLYPMYDVACTYIDSSNGFWIKGVDENGELIHTQAMRLLDLSGTTLADHFRLHRQKYMTPGNTDDPTQYDYSPTPACQKISGRVCYHGELWLKEDDGKRFRGTGLTTILPRMALALSLMEWSPDFVFGFMYPHAACRGLAAREGYMHMEPGFWHAPGSPESFAEWLVWMAREDLEHLMRFAPGELYQQLEAQRSKKTEKSSELHIAGREWHRPQNAAMS
ncbi:hypothetical protein HBA54_01375 [Pelagibius litoralis]|uniref:Uncharacterized protein n=1 Tax=Pelagibius litoralis TaxID=374515 RepID=A0A967C1W9_9PROT|nr:hypothetical protein [Pelagibius litoralis]NIA67238.1 hypothetical protein [Pelagibius litoralis]